MFVDERKRMTMSRVLIQVIWVEALSVRNLGLLVSLEPGQASLRVVRVSGTRQPWLFAG
jgi:hypothetical protein